MTEVFEPSSWRSREGLDAYMQRHGVPGISGIDTRALVRRIREGGAQVGVLSTDPAADADALLAQVVDLRDKAFGIFDKAEGSDDLRVAVSAIREARGCVELLAKLAGELKDAPIINLVVSAEWLTVQAAVLMALEPHPKARLDVASALERIDCAGRA